VLINKALIEIPPKFAGRAPVNPESSDEFSHNGKGKKKLLEKEWPGSTGLAEDVRHYGKWIRDEAQKRIAHLYPQVDVTEQMAGDRPDLKAYIGQKLTIIAWLWSRTVASPNPACGGAHTPLVRSFWLSTKPGKESFVRPIINREANTFTFKVLDGKPSDGFDPSNGTVNRRGGRCLLSGDPMPFTHIRGEGQAGRMGVRLMAIIAEGKGGRVYISPQEVHVQIAESARAQWQPEAELPNNPRDFKTPNYGMNTFAALFTPRQLTSLTTLGDLISEAHDKIRFDAARTHATDEDRPLAAGGSGPMAYADAVTLYLAFAN
jgi:putative DNA methylase